MSESPKRPRSAFGTGLVASFRAAAGEALARRETKGSRLAVADLPEDVTQLAPGGLYVVYAMPRTQPCDALIWNTARDAATRHVTVVLARTQAQIAERMRALGFVEGVPARGWPRKLNVLSMPPAAAIDVDASHPVAGGARVGAAPPFARLIGALRALKRFGFRTGSLYLVEGAERWFSWQDPAVLAREGRLLADWCARRGVTLVLIVHPTPAQPFEDTDVIAREERFDDEASHSSRGEFHGACAGVARMRRAHGELLWFADFWRAGRALVTAEVHALRFTEGGELTVAPDAVGAGRGHAGTLLARDEERVVASRAVVSNETWVPDEWEIVDDIDAAVAASRGAVAATVLLDYTDGAGLERLCAAVHTLRRQCGRALKIVVVERQQALRHQYELLLLSLGANLLLGRDLPFSRMQSLLRSLQGQLDTRPIAADYKASLAAALADDVRGYLPAKAFCERVQDVLARGAMLQLPHVLVKLTLLSSAAHVDALRRCAPRRAGDVFTADAAHIYVFLFACRLPDADAALARIFDSPLRTWSDDVVFLADDSIGREIAALAAADRRLPLADYSDLFAAARAAPSATPGGVTPERSRASGIVQHAETKGAGEAKARLEAVERAIDAARADAAHACAPAADGVAPSAAAPLRAAPPRRFAERCAMPLRTRVPEEK